MTGNGIRDCRELDLYPSSFSRAALVITYVYTAECSYMLVRLYENMWAIIVLTCEIVSDEVE